jgi:CheY-like chemotaxis protein
MMPLRTILLVDDDLELRGVIAAILAEPGYTVLTATDGYEALRVLVERVVDLLITDVNPAYSQRAKNSGWRGDKNPAESMC